MQVFSIARRIVAACILTAALGTPGMAQTTLPVAVQADLLLLQIEAALTNGQQYRARDLMSELRALQAPLSPGQLQQLEARVAIANDDFLAAADHLASLLASVERGSDSYRDGLDMLSQLDQQRTRRLATLSTEARIAELRGDFDTSTALLTKLLGQTPRGSDAYPENLARLAGVDARKADFQRRQQAEQLTRDERLKQLEIEWANERSAQDRELQLADSHGDYRDRLLHLRFILNARYRADPDVEVFSSDALTEDERGFLAQFRKDKGLEAGLHPVALGYVDAAVLDAAATEPFQSIMTDTSKLPAAVVAGDWVTFKTGRGTQTSCMMASAATQVRPLPEYRVPWITFFVRERQDTNSLISNVLPVPAGGQITVDVDQRSFPVTVNDRTLLIPRDGSMTKAMRRGTTMTLRTTSAYTGRQVELTYSLRGFTKAFEEMARMCGVPEALLWIR